MEFKLKNYVKEDQKLPMFGIGPYLIYGKYNNRFQGADQYCIAVLPGVFAGILYALSDRSGI